MRPAHVKAYLTAFELNTLVTNDAVARVLKPDSPDYTLGELVLGSLTIAEYAVVDGPSLLQRAAIRSKVANPHGFELGMFLGPLGIAGLTGFSSLYEIGKTKRGETIFTSFAAGAVGQVVGQIAKREGLRVVGSVGSDEKLELIWGSWGLMRVLTIRRRGR